MEIMTKKDTKELIIQLINDFVYHNENAKDRQDKTYYPELEKKIYSNDLEGFGKFLLDHLDE